MGIWWDLFDVFFFFNGNLDGFFFSIFLWEYHIMGIFNGRFGRNFGISCDGWPWDSHGTNWLMEILGRSWESLKRWSNGQNRTRLNMMISWYYIVWTWLNICIKWMQNKPLRESNKATAWWWLVAIHFVFSHMNIGLHSSSQLTFIFFRGVNQPPTSKRGAMDFQRKPPWDDVGLSVTNK